MKIHEYQAKQLFAGYGIEVPAGGVASSVDEAVDQAGRLGAWPVVVKAQIHAGGRGKGGGVRLAASPGEVKDAAGSILGMMLVTPQTGPSGQRVRKVLVEAGLDIKRELYLGMVPERESADIVIMASRYGGMDIEEVAEKDPAGIIKVPVDPVSGVKPYHLREAAYNLELPASAVKPFISMLEGMYNLFTGYDCSLLEINPLVLTAEDHVVALDAKVDFDDNALYRHPDLKSLKDVDEEDPLELEASEARLNYITMDGNIGNIVNGAGLAMATMDIIKKAGAAPANFLDVGGGASSEMVEKALRIILKDSKVKAVLINIFGGILRCDVFARGIVAAAKKSRISIPVVVRMEGTNVEEGRSLLRKSGLDFRTAVDLADAAGKIAAIVKGLGKE